ncbi:P-loop containing nucleoside triphosphate hydrolase protein [Guyanagaster necrorhizus]|uniref:P-loop containing nucleoside triphosphate hydrolase protein n=1 Tax=Guyanagaster necrorhizus TaxID=856835 RepID=A0A9P8AXX4_9AGAR|nr:P-loop containing nucleoside triphosphate hydrolase protein [Guyanagaster necrorhizus MCA 3950]KAG7452254.1 P-loop containing nucleoside triphosphate hydrolase protein [Guyanagaster necrorhizus MCA 3950]
MFVWETLSLSVIVYAIAYDVGSRIRFPKSIRKVYLCFVAPFKNFLTLADLADPVGEPSVPSITITRALSVLACLQAFGWLGCLVYALVLNDASLSTTFLLKACSWGYILCRTTTLPPVTPPYLSISYAFLQAFTSFVRLGVEITKAYDGTVIVLDSFCLITASLFVYIAGTLPVQLVRPALNIAQYKDMPSVSFSMPEDDVTLWSWFTFSFIEPIFSLANARTLNESDVWGLSPYFQHKNLFNKYLEYNKRYPGHSLIRFLLVSNSLDLILDVVLELWSAVVGFLPAYALQEILSALAKDNPESRQDAYYWAAVTFLAHLSFAQVDLFQSWHTRRCYERTRGQLFCTLHYKSLRRRNVEGQVKREGSENEGGVHLGKIVNLMQGDAYAVSQRFWEFSALITSPIRLVIALVFLYNVMGWAAISGVLIVLVAYVLNYPLATYNISITRASWKAKDARMGIVNELLQNIRFLKFYGWEYHWSFETEKARETELRWRVKENIVATLISFIWIWIPSATALTTFLCYTLVAGQRLTVSKAFTAIALFSQLQRPMTALPGQVFAILHAYVSMQRIENFLQEEEVPEWASTLTASSPFEHEDQIGFSEAAFEWGTSLKTPSSLSQFQLGPLNIVFPNAKLTVISGPTGSGKSATLSALLGEIHCLSGRVFLNKQFHQVAYCAQNPWLEHATIRDNIIFGSSFGYDEGRYNTVVEACALVKDLDILEAGDMTEIGEKGITLSGGQRARIALARAMYSEAKCILLDDPLAAVDMHTAQHLVHNCLSGNLVEGRTIILVTHHISLCLPITSHIIELSHGKVFQQGSVQELEERGVLHKVIDMEDQPFVSDDNLESSATTVVNEADEVNKDPGPRKTLLKSGNGKLIQAEARAKGRVSMKTYLTYIRAAGIISWILTVFLMLLIRFINIGNQVFLSAWGEAYEDRTSLSAFIARVMASSVKYPWSGFPSPDTSVKPWLMVYFYISMAGAFSVISYISLGYYASLQASRSIFISLLRRITRAPARFFDTTPIGRILNRFTGDINTIDGALQNSARECLSGILDFVASFLVVLVVVPVFAPFALFIAWLYIRLAPSYIRASRDLRRLESVSLSPAFAGFDELLRGIVHVRAFGMEQRYQNAFYAKVDRFQTFDHVYWLVNGWLRWRYDCLGSVVVFATTVFALRMGLQSGAVAIVIVQAGIFAEASRQLVRVAAQLELDFNSVERVVEYLDLPQEAPAIIENSKPPAFWPSSSGELVVEDLVVQYAPELPAVLKSLSFVINPSEKIGVVGRTGSGKSTLALSLLRMVEPVSGRIYIDGIDISKIGLEDLRTRITIVSQDVSLFSGTLRSNLDPLNQNTWQECMEVVERCHMMDVLHLNTSDLLDLPISQGSLSGGERQLVALARAMLRRTNIIIMDEATSQIDSHLDDQIQRTIREELSSAIVITIAHRLKTIIDYDRILVLDEGEIVEFGKPKELLQRVGGAFREMCKKSPDWPMLAKLSE